jgi:superfamily II DNA or RNA helicase
LSLGFPCYRYNIYQWRFYGQRISEMELNVDENRELSRQTGIYGIFRTIFLKRLESSLHSIWLSLNNYEGKLLQFQDKLNTINKIVSVKDISRLNELIALYNEQSSDEDELDFDIPEFETDKKINLIDADPAVFRIDILKADIDKDLQIIAVLRQQVSKLMEHDNKLVQLANKLDELSDQKVLVFTYFADTLKYLNDKLPSLLRQKRNVEFALGNKNEIENFACRFAPLSKKYEVKSNEKEIDVLCATDKLSEGQNLQDCGIIINYDLHWNPVRMIQRNGRINRLGTKHKEISIYNFRPTEQLESYLLLIRKLQAKIDLIRYTIGSDQSVLDEEPMPQDFTEDLYSRDEKKRIAALKKIHETSELIGAEDIHMDNLRAFNNNEDLDESYQRSIYEMPRGKWGKISMPKPDDEFAHIAHVSDQSGEAGYFVSLSEAGESRRIKH